ncbi:M56 family metallopeptidase [Clostridium sp. A1-XYC3]|uniref:M56 family metallopeptidase n=1 Tax=Clostridium tanneri TaxID=3037988 RepID=A0ABU4JQM7_9CLOT|nr:M56 family metallopeptidase [Clostridium sp. A1-XYC3]MDW8800462.1 M56 family metallopeptidase [Clostridium sp. A1-XYC3]
MNLLILFKTVIPLSFMGSIVALLIVMIKQLFNNRLSAKWHYYIWFLLILRLIIPYNLQSNFSIFNLFSSAQRSIQLLQNNILNKDNSIKEQDHSNENLQNKAINNDSTKEINSNLKDKVTIGNSINKEIYKNNTMDISIVSNNRSAISSYLAGIWFIGILTIIIYVITVNMRLQRIGEKGSKWERDNITQLLQQCKKEMKVKGDISIIINNENKAPYLLGLLKPKIFIFSGIIDEFSMKEIRYIFLHELAHVKRKDILINWTIILVQAIHWFNPVIWYALNRMKLDCEIACDETVLNSISFTERVSYGETIINLTKMFFNNRLAPGVTGMINKSELKRRIIMISKFSKKSIKRTVITILVTLILAGVGLTNANESFKGYLGLNSSKENKEKGISKEESEVLTSEKQRAILDNLDDLIKKDTSTNQFIKVVNDNVAKVSKEYASTMIFKLEEMQKKNLPKLEERFSNDDMQSKINKIYNINFNINKIDYIEDKELKDLLVETRNGGYKIETAEGMYFPVLDYESYKQYSPYVTEDIKNYIQIMAVESNKTPIKDAALMISWDELLKRALKQEEFISKYGNSVKINDVRQLYKQYIVFILYGANNTPIFQYDTKELVPEAKISYTNAIKESNNSETLGNIKGFINILEESNYKITEKVESYRKGILEKM